MLTGTVLVKDYFGGRNMSRVVGVRGMVTVMASQFRGRRALRTAKDAARTAG
jgi:hypothetical protein